MQRVIALLYAAAGTKMDFEVYQALGATASDSYTRSMTIAATYETSNGKFPSAYGNVALMDCHYLLDYLFDYARNVYAPTLPLV